MEPVNIENLENILTRIWNGELEHNQTGFFCGTACCLAGWDVALNAEEQPVFAEQRLDWYLKEASEAYGHPWAWSREHNNLTIGEARLLFDVDSTKYLHEVTLEALKQGRRLNYEDFGIRVNSGYKEGVVRLYCVQPHILEEFLGETDQNKFRILQAPHR